MKNYILLTEIKEKEHNKNIIEYKYLYEKLTEYYQKENEFDIIGIENYKREKNELLIEFINRINYANLNFFDVGKGWRSDRGRIYIIYGPPEMIERSSEQSDGVYEKWIYPSGRTFTFLDRNRFGNFILIRQGV